MNKQVIIFSMGILMAAQSLCAAEPTKSVASSDDNDNNNSSYTTVSTQYDGDWRFRMGGYGEMLGTWKDYGINRWSGSNKGNSKINHAEVSLPRFILALDYKFSDKWILGAEIEFEAGGTGTAYELETGTGSENGEYESEMEKGGEVALEQFHITRLIVPQFNVRVGHMVLPVGLTNRHHEPTNFFGTARNEGETTFLPSTWHETGIEFFGSFGKGYAAFNYQAMIVAGLNPNGFSKYDWVAGGRQGIFETDNFSSPAWIGRLDYVGVPGLRVGASYYFVNNAGANSDKLITYDQVGKIPVRIFTADAQYINRYVTARANFMTGHIGHAAAIGRINNSYSSKSPYSRFTPIASGSMTYMGEVGFNLKTILGKENFPVIYPFAHYEYYNPQQEADVDQIMDKRCQVSLWKFGLNWKPLPNLVVKADYTMRQIGTQKVFGKGLYNSENEFGLAVAYVGWFFQK